MVWFLQILQGWAIPLLGVALTAGIFIYQSRQSISAETERRSRANQELIDLLVRRLILEGFYPAVADVEKIRSGLATKHNLDQKELISNEALENSVIFHVISNDYIVSEKRQEILTTIRTNRPRPTPPAEFLLRVASESSGFPPVFKNFSIWRDVWANAIAAVIIAISAGLLVSVLQPQVLGTVSTWATLREIVLPISIGGAFAIIAIMWLIYSRTLRKKQALERVSVRSELASFESPETRVLQILMEARDQEKIQTVVAGSGQVKCDFIVTMHDNKRIAIEIKQRGFMPQKVIQGWLARLEMAVEETSSELGLLITGDNFKPRISSVNGSSKIRILALNELAPFISDLAKRDGASQPLKAV